MAKKKKLTVRGVEYDLVERMGYNHSTGCYACVVDTANGTEIVVSEMARGPWRFWTPRDRVGPLREAAKHGWPANQK